MKTPYVNLQEKQVWFIILAIVILFTFLYNVRAIAQSGSDMNSFFMTESGMPVSINLAEQFSASAKAVPMNAGINSQLIEIKSALDPAGNRLYFSRLPFQASITGNKYNEDIWYTEFDAASNEWLAPKKLEGDLNNAGPNFVNGITDSGDTLILGNEYHRKGKMFAGLSYSVKVAGEWTSPRNIKIKNDYNTSEHANHYVSLKHGVIISAIERAETVGERDLYISFWNGKTATEPVNMGSVINTYLEESSPWLACDGKTLFFASKGHAGFGGYDIFMTTRLDDTWTNWSTPQNVGPAINGPMDEEHFAITRCNQFALFSKQVDTNNVDLFRISMEELLNKSEDAKDKLAQKVKLSSLASL